MKSKAHTKKYYSFLLNILLCLIFFISFYACGGGGNSDGSNTGSIAFGVNVQNASSSRLASSLSRAVINCTATEIVTLTATILDDNDQIIATGGPWQCELGQGSVAGVPPGENRKVVLEAKDFLDVTTFKGQSEIPLTIVAGETTDAGIITLQLFEPRVLVTSNTKANVSLYEYTGNGGIFIDEFVTTDANKLSGPWELVFGPDGNLYISSAPTDKVPRYDGKSGDFIDEFTKFPNPADTAKLDSPRGLVFGPDDDLYVSSGNTDSVLKFNGITGNFIGEFVTVRSGGLAEPSGLTFGPDGNLYVGSIDSDQVLVYEGLTGDFEDVFTKFPDPKDIVELEDPHDLVFGPEGHLYVTSTGKNQVVRFDGQTGDFMGVFIPPGSGDSQLLFPAGLVFGPDGFLYVCSRNNDRILRFDGRTADFIDVFIANANSPRPAWMIFSGNRF